MERYSKTVEPGTVNFWKHTFMAMMNFQIQLQFTGGPRSGETQVAYTSFGEDESFRLIVLAGGCDRSGRFYDRSITSK
jgi:hypothetical protein